MSSSPWRPWESLQPWSRRFGSAAVLPCGPLLEGHRKGQGMWKSNFYFPLQKQYLNYGTRVESPAYLADHRCSKWCNSELMTVIMKAETTTESTNTQQAFTSSPTPAIGVKRIARRSGKGPAHQKQTLNMGRPSTIAPISRSMSV